MRLSGWGNPFTSSSFILHTLFFYYAICTPFFINIWLLIGDFCGNLVDKLCVNDVLLMRFLSNFAEEK